MIKEELRITTEYNGIKDMVADIKNKMSPLMLYFEMLKDIENGEYDDVTKEKLQKILDTERQKCPVCIDYIECVLNKICEHVG